MFQQMFTGLQGEGPLGGNGATGVWRSFLTDEYCQIASPRPAASASPIRSMRALLAQQEVRS